MIVYHGTSAARAEKICREGFLPRKPSRRVFQLALHDPNPDIVRRASRVVADKKRFRKR